MIIHDFNLRCVSVFPNEAQPELIVDADAVPALPVAFQCFKRVAWRLEIAQSFSGIELEQFANGHFLDSAKSL